MRKIAATYIFPLTRPPLKFGILTCTCNGSILDLIDTEGILHEQAGLEFYSGIIVPGCINENLLNKLIQKKIHSQDQTIQQLFEWIVDWMKSEGIPFIDFKKDENPGINLITGIDFIHLKFKSTARVKTLLPPIL